MDIHSQVALFRGVCKYRPVGIHRHFRMIGLTKFVNQEIGASYTSQQLLEFLSQHYDLDKLDSDFEQVDFDLPWDEYGDLIEQCCKADVESQDTPVKSPQLTAGFPLLEEEEPVKPRKAGKRKSVGKKTGKRKT